MNWIKDLTNKIKPKLENLFNKKSTLPDNLWTNCASCSNIIYREDIKNNLYCCTNCQEPQQILPRKRFEILFDEGAYEELETPRLSSDPLNWSDISSYKDKVKKARKKTGSQGYHHQKPFLIVVLCARFSIFDPLSITMVMELSWKNETISTKSYQGNMY